MKKTLIALAALAAVGTVSAQAVISGSINIGMQHSALDAYGNGGLKGDRNFLAFSDTEDLGNGLKVSGYLNARFNSINGTEKYLSTATGSNNDMLFEQTKIAVDGPFGQIALGRFTNFIGLAPVHFMEDSGFGAASTSIYGRMSSQLQYATPVFSGFQAFALHAKATDNKFSAALAGNGFNPAYDLSTSALASGSLNDFAAFGVNYANGPLFVHVATMSGLVGDKDSKWAATYNFGPAKVSVGQFRQGADIGYTAITAVAANCTLVAGVCTAPTTAAVAARAAYGVAAHTSTEYGVEVPFGNFLGAVTYQTNDKDMAVGKTDGSSQMTKLGAKLYYSLSKRTTLEFETANVTNGGASSNGTSDNGTSYYTGIRHTF